MSTTRSRKLWDWFMAESIEKGFIDAVLDEYGFVCFRITERGRADLSEYIREQEDEV